MLKLRHMIKKISAFVADIDGTLALKGEALMPITKQALIDLHNQGIQLGLATGRPVDSRTIYKAKEWELPFDFDFVIGINGGELWDKAHPDIEKTHQLSCDTVKEIMGLLEGLDINVIKFVNGYDLVYTLRMDDILKWSTARNHSTLQFVKPEDFYKEPSGKIEVHCTDENLPLLMKRIQEHPSKDWITMTTFHNTVEFMDPHLNKGTGLKLYAKRNGIDLEEIIAFGDEENDLAMLEVAGWGVCLSNGIDACKKAANAITDFPVTEDGVGKYLYQNGLI